MLDKIIDRILDRYYARKLAKNISLIFEVRGIDAEYKYTEKTLVVRTKKREYKDDYYKSILSLSYDECIYCLANINEFDKRIFQILNEKYGGEK